MGGPTLQRRTNIPRKNWPSRTNFPRDQNYRDSTMYNRQVAICISRRSASASDISSCIAAPNFPSCGYTGTARNILNLGLLIQIATCLPYYKYYIHTHTHTHMYILRSADLDFTSVHQTSLVLALHIKVKTLYLRETMHSA